MLRSCAFWVTYECNYQCPYCAVRSWDKDTPGIVPAEKWVQAFNRYNQLTIDITGGEPLLYPQIDKLVSDLSRRHNLAITSNFNRDPGLDFWRHFFSITLSFHPSMLDPGQQADFLRRATQLRKDYKGSLSVNYVAHLPQIGQIPLLKQAFEQGGIRFNVDPQSNVNYTGEQIEFLAPYVGLNRLIGQPRTDFFGKTRWCSAGSTYVQIRPDGRMRPCFGLPVMGSFIDESPSFFHEPVECSSGSCSGCDYDACFMYDKGRNLIKPGK